jgi:hypothetical protein
MYGKIHSYSDKSNYTHVYFFFNSAARIQTEFCRSCLHVVKVGIRLVI